MCDGFRQAFAEATAVARSPPAEDCRSYSGHRVMDSHRAVVPALCAGRLRPAQWILLDVCRSACRCAFLSGRGLPELQQRTAGATAADRARDAQRAVVPALCAGRHGHAQWILLDVCRSACGCAFFSGRGLPELQRTASSRKMATRRCSSGTLCRKAQACAMDFARRLPRRQRLRVPLRQRTAGATTLGILARDANAPL